MTPGEGAVMPGEGAARQALSLHEPLLAATCGGKVLSVHRRAVNLLLDDGSLLSLVDPSLGNGPGAVLVTGVWRLPWAPGHRIVLTGHTLAGPGASVGLDGAARWAPPPPPGMGPRLVARREAGQRAALKSRLAAVASVLADDGSPAGLLPAALSALDLSVPAMRPRGPLAVALCSLGLQGIASLLRGDWETGVRRLSGLGPGSTPSGDDLLCGFVCTLVRAGARAGDALGATIRRIPASASTPLSRHFLHWATQGVAGEHGVTFADELLRGPGPGADSALVSRCETLLRPVLCHGATSGSDWASGAMLALDYLGREVSRSEAV